MTAPLPAFQDELDARYRAALRNHERGALAAAVRGYRAVLRDDPGRAAAHSNLGVALQALGRHDEAIAAHRRALATGGPIAAVLGNLGAAFVSAGRIAEARDALEKAIALAPGSAIAHLNLGNAVRGAGAPEVALAHYREAQALAPGMAAAHSNEGLALKDLGQLDAATQAFRRALALEPGSAELHYNLGNAFRLGGALGDAADALERAVALDPAHLRARSNLGVVWRERGETGRAIAHFDALIGGAPNHADAQWNRALALLLAGDFARGWPAYEWRWSATPLVPRSMAAPRWDGADPAGRTILLWPEQGYGDTIQFMRFAPEVSARGGRVIVRVQPPLARLLADFAGVESVLADQGAPPPCDLHAPLMSLPALLGHAELPAARAYLRAPERGPADLAAALERRSGARRVGIVWAGSAAHENDRNRSCPPALLERLAGVAGVALLGLQREPGPRPRGLSGDLGPMLGDFADTAFALDRLDLVITVDTAVAHLAGALGRPVWLLLPHAPDWRWMLARDDSPWYPTARLFRQPVPGDWESVLSAVAAALERHAG